MNLYERYCRETFDEAGRLTKVSLRWPAEFNFAYDVADEMARQAPEQVAMVWCDPNGAEATFSFSDLARGSDRVARVFWQAGIRPGDRVMVALKRHYEYWFVALALHKLGAVLVPVTHMLTAEDIAYRLDCAPMRALVCTPQNEVPRHVLDAVAGRGEQPLLWTVRETVPGFRNLTEEARREPAAFARIATRAEDPMLMYFTSGTTGRSKGVMLSEKNFFSVMRAHTQIGEHMMAYKHEPDLVMSQYTVLPMFHLGAFICLFSWAHAGWALNVSSDIRNFYKEVKRMPSQAMAVVPVIMNSLHHDVMRGRKERLGELWVPICSSAMFDPQVMLDMAEHGMFVVQTYGSTETCGDGIINYAQDAKHIGAVGQGNDYLDYKIAEDGELCMRGDSIMLGYYKDPEATAEVIDADGWFHTGDLARKDEDGYYFLTGRKKNLIILDSGENISPEELEGIVGKCEAVKECVVKEMGKKIGVVVY